MTLGKKQANLFNEASVDDLFEKLA